MHAHVNKPPKREGAAKIWIHADGRTTLDRDNNGNIKGNISLEALEEVQEYIMNNIIFMRQKWAGWKGTTIEAIVYYRGNIEECWTCEYGQYILGDKTFYGDNGDLLWVNCVCSNIKDADPKKLITAYGGKDCKFFIKKSV
jgi:hypothetical protein